MTPAEKVATKVKRRRRSDRPPPGLTWSCELRRLRDSLGLTARDVAEHCAMTHAAVNFIERGTNPRLTNARKLAAFFGVTVEEMWPSLINPKETT